MHILLASFQARYSNKKFIDTHGQNESLKGLLDILDDEYKISIWTPNILDPQWKGLLKTCDLINTIKIKNPDIVHLVLPTPNFQFIGNKIIKKVEPPVIIQYNSSLIRGKPPRPKNLSDALWLSEKLMINHELGGKLFSLMQNREKDPQLIVSSKFQRDQLVDVLNHEVSNINIIPNNSSKNLYCDERRTKKYKTSEKIDFGYLGHTTLAKGVEDLIEAFSKIEYDCELHLALSGKGKDIKKHLKTDECSRIKFYGVVERSSFFGGIDAMVLPYRCAFGTQIFPNTILESLYSGIPVITSELPYMDEIIAEKENGLLFAPGDVEELKETLKTFCRKKSLQRKLSTGEVPDKLKPKNIKDKLKELYNETIELHNI